MENSRLYILKNIVVLFIYMLLIRTGEAEIKMLDNNSLKFADPFAYNVEKARLLGLSDGEKFNELYFQLQKYYADVLIDYLDEILDLQGLDQALANNEMRFVPNSEPQNIYQLYFSKGMKYIFIRNNICIERLSQEKIQILKNYINVDADLDNNDLKEFLQETMALVTKGDDTLPEKTKLIYEPDGKSADNMSVVIGLATMPEYDEKGMYISGLHEMEKDEYLEKLCHELEKRMSELLQYPVAVFLYK